MSGFAPNDYPAHDPRDSLTGAAYIGEQYNVGSMDVVDEEWSGMTELSDSRFQLQDDLAPVYISAQHTYSSADYNHARPPMAFHQDDGPVQAPLQPGYVDPAQLLKPGASYVEPMDQDVFDDWHNSIGIYNGHEATASDQVNGQRPILTIARAGSRNGHEASGSRGSSRRDMTDADHRGDIERPVSMLVDTAQSSMSIPERLDNVFVPGVLKRQEDHEERLDVYMDQLMGFLAPSNEVSLVPSTVGKTFVLDRMSFHSPNYDNQQTTLDTMRMESFQAGDGTHQQTNRVIPSWHVTEDDQMVVEPEISESRSRYVAKMSHAVASALTSSRDTPGTHLYPESSSQVSSAPSPTNTDASSLEWLCPFDNCNARFTGRFGKGNLGRHRRQKHAGRPIEYPCGDGHCTRTFKRKDARLKHHRKAHPYLDEHVIARDDHDNLQSGDWTNELVQNQWLGP